jgi:hypothetical protein
MLRFSFSATCLAMALPVFPLRPAAPCGSGCPAQLPARHCRRRIVEAEDLPAPDDHVVARRDGPSAYQR